MGIEEAFGFVLSTHRKELGLNQEELAFRCNLDRTFISLLERGKRQPSLDTIFKLSKELQMSPSELIKEVEDTLKNN